MTNPLLEEHLLPPFSKIKPEHILPALKQVLDENLSEIDRLLSIVDSPFWDNLIAPIDELEKRRSNLWAPIPHMNNVVNSQELREEYEKCIPLNTEYSTQIGQNKKLYEAYVEISESDEYDGYSKARKKVISNALRDFKLSGIALPKEKQKRFGELQAELSQLANSFSNNVLDATMAWTKNITDEKELAGLPEGPKAAAREAAKAKGLDGWLFTLDIPSFQPVMTYCSNRDFRQEMYTAFVTRASDQGPDEGKFDNTEIIEKIMILRVEMAELLGFDNFAELSLATKMADSTEAVLSFLNNMAERTLPQGREDIEEVREFSRSLDINDMKIWDTGYVGEKLREKKYAFSKEEVRQYFAADRVISGMFTIVNKLYGIEVKQVTEFDSWHDDVRFYKVLRDNKEIASFFLDHLPGRINAVVPGWMFAESGASQQNISNSQSPTFVVTSQVL